MYSGTSIIRISFIWHLDYPDMLNSAKCINMQTQRAWPMTVWGCGYSWSRSLDAIEICPGQNWLTCVFVWMLLTVIILYRYPLKTRHHKFSEKSKHFSYSNYFTYLVYQHQGCDQRGPDNQGSTVYTNFVVTFHGDKQLKFPSPDPLSIFHKRSWSARLIIGLVYYYYSSSIIHLLNDTSH